MSLDQGSRRPASSAPEPKTSEPEANEESIKRRRICPYLGLRQDRTDIAGQPSEVHACHAQEDRIFPSIEHQTVRCFTDTYSECTYYPKMDKETVPYSGLYTLVDSVGSERRMWTSWLISILVLLILAALVVAYLNDIIPTDWISDPGEPSATEVASFVTTEEPTSTFTPTSIDTNIGQQAITPRATILAAPTNTLAAATSVPDAGGQELRLTPRETDVSWWMSSELQRGFVGESFLYAGFLDQKAYVSAVRFDLRPIPRGSPILGTTLRIVGLQDDRLERNTGMNWSVQVIAERDLPTLLGVDFATIFGASASLTLSPALQTTDVVPGQVNQWLFDENARTWLFQQMLDGATSVTIRISPFPVVDGALFAWDSGYGSESNGAAPELIFELGLPPTNIVTPD